MYYFNTEDRSGVIVELRFSGAASPGYGRASVVGQRVQVLVRNAGIKANSYNES